MRNSPISKPNDLPAPDLFTKPRQTKHQRSKRYIDKNYLQQIEYLESSLSNHNAPDSLNDTSYSIEPSQLSFETRQLIAKLYHKYVADESGSSVQSPQRPSKSQIPRSVESSLTFRQESIVYMPESFNGESEISQRQMLSIIDSSEEVEASKTIQDFSCGVSETEDDRENSRCVTLLPETTDATSMFNSELALDRAALAGIKLRTRGSSRSISVAESSLYDIPLDIDIETPDHFTCRLNQVEQPTKLRPKQVEESVDCSMSITNLSLND